MLDATMLNMFLSTEFPSKKAKNRKTQAGSPAWVRNYWPVTQLRNQIETVCVHHLGPGRHEVFHELLGIVVLGIDLCIGPQDRV